MNKLETMKLEKLCASIVQGPNRGAEAARLIAEAMQEPLREGVMSGPILNDIYTPVEFKPSQSIEFELSWLVPGTERDHVAWTAPNEGQISHVPVSGDFVTLPTYRIVNRKTTSLNYIEQSRTDVLQDMLDNLKEGFQVKLNNDGFHVLLAAGLDRNILCFDANAAAGQFTKRLVSILKTTEARNGGGNSTSLRKWSLTDLILSLEGMEDIRNWGVDIIDEYTRREIFVNEGKLNRIFGVNLHPLYELGVGQEYQLYFTSLGGTMAASDEEIVVGLDLTKRKKCFVMPYRSPNGEMFEVFEDWTVHPEGRFGYYGWGRPGFGCLDGRAVILGSF